MGKIIDRFELKRKWKIPAVGDNLQSLTALRGSHTLLLLSLLSQNQTSAV